METSNDSYSVVLGHNYPLIDRALRRVARRRGLSAEEADDLRSAVHLKLVERNYAVLRAFQGRSALSTYLQRVIDRVWLDAAAANGRRWRSSAEARRLGATAIRLERLLEHDRVPFDQACDVLIMNAGAVESRDELERLRAALPARRVRPSVYRLDSLDALPSPNAPDATECADPYHEAVSRRLPAALATLGDMEQRLLRLRFARGWTVARIARVMDCEQKSLYREFQRIFKQLRATLMPDDTVVRLAADPANPWDPRQKRRFNCSNGLASAMPPHSMHSS